MRLSIVVPVYNVEAYLRKCIDSLLKQDIAPDDYEVILVDDGSNDSSGSICDEAASSASNIRVIHKANGGLSSARNTGINKAAGKYIQFVDSDDYLVPNVLGSLLSQIESANLDILRFNYQNVTEKGVVFEPNKYSKPFVNYSSDVCDGLTFLNERLGFACYAVQFMIKTQLIKDPIFRFKEGICFEDVEWTPRVILQAKRIASTSLVAYNYLFRAGSITRSQGINKKKKSLEDQFELLNCLEYQAEAISDPRWFKGMIAHITIAIINRISNSFFSERKSYLHQLHGKRVFPLSTFHSTKSTKRKIILANISPSLLCSLLHYSKLYNRPL